MTSEKKELPFEGTKEQEQELKKIIKELRAEKGCLMPIMQKAQNIYGYLPIEVQTIISNELRVPLEKIYGVATFYSQFSLTPKGKHKVSVCLGTACYIKGAGDIYDKIVEILGIVDGECTNDRLFSLETSRCVGACGLAPVMIVDDDVHGRITVKDVETIINKYREVS